MTSNESVRELCAHRKLVVLRISRKPISAMFEFSALHLLRAEYEHVRTTLRRDESVGVRTLYT